MTGARISVRAEEGRMVTIAREDASGIRELTVPAPEMMDAMLPLAEAVRRSMGYLDAGVDLQAGEPGSDGRIVLVRLCGPVVADAVSLSPDDAMLLAGDLLAQVSGPWDGAGICVVRAGDGVAVSFGFGQEIEKLTPEEAVRFAGRICDAAAEAIREREEIA